jgi:hypothetical protein
VSGNTPTSPAQWLYGLYRALPGGAGLLSPSPLRSLLLKSLAPASRRQDHTTSPYAAEPFAFDRRVHRIPRPTCHDDGDTPLWRARDGGIYNSDFQKCKAKYFRAGPDNPNQLEIAHEIRFQAPGDLRALLPRNSRRGNNCRSFPFVAGLELKEPACADQPWYSQFRFSLLSPVRQPQHCRAHLSNQES